MSSHYFIFYYIILLKYYPNCVWTFNIETNDYTIYKGGIQSMFGFSVAEYRDEQHRGWVIVGAPLNQTFQKGINKGGAVFKCDIAEDNRCFPIEFDKKGVDYVRSTKNPKGIEPIDDKSYQWFGATIATSMKDGGPLLACAPKYHWFGYIKANWSVAGFKDVVGACWLTTMRDGSSIEYSPCRNNDTAGHHRQGMCQAGIGAALTKDGKRIFIGAPGSWYWQGQLFTIESNVTLPFVPVKEVHNPLAKEGLTSSYEQLNLLATSEGPAYEDNNYLGYSVIVGDFLGNSDSGVAVGVPRGSELHGKVLLFTSQLFNHQNITGEQMGAYFGYALAVNDIDGDDRDDLIITAPFYSRPEFAGVKIETGRIYIFYQGGDSTKYQKYDTRDGENNRGQFGLSVASLGDIDLDGYGDFVIGEPYGGLENRGAIYIYYGTKNGVEEKFSQVIYSENLEKPIRTFGWSVSGALDLDGNNYPDIVVGAYESNTVTYFRSRPVINIYSEINFLSKSVNLQNKACIISDGTAVSCSELKICCMYTGSGSWPQHNFTIHLLLDDKKKNPRLFFLDFENKHTLNWTITIVKDQHHCRQIKVYVTQHLRDKLTSLDAEMYIELLQDSNELYSNWRKRDPTRKLMAILGPKNTRKRDSLIIQKNCGSDNVCIPDLVINVMKNVEKYLLGSEKILELEVSIQNVAEDAFETIFYLQLPTGIDYINIESQSESTEIIIQCSAPKSSNNNTLRCDIGNPLPGGKMVKFKIFLQPITFYGMKPTYELNMKVNSTNFEVSDTLWNNIYNITLPIWIETDLSIEGDSKPQEIDFNSIDYANSDPILSINTYEFGPIVTHNYTIRNNGPSTVLNIATSLIWAAETYSGDILLYLIEQPEISNNKIRCDSANANYLSFKETNRVQNKVQSLNDSELLASKLLRNLWSDVKNSTINNIIFSKSRIAQEISLQKNNTIQKSEGYRINKIKELNKRYIHKIFKKYIDFKNKVNDEDTTVDVISKEDRSKYLSKRAVEKIINRRYLRHESKNFKSKTFKKSIRYPQLATKQLLLQNKENDDALISNTEILCSTAQCVDLQCHVGPLIKDEEVSISVRYRINIKSLKKITQSEKIKVSTKLLAIVTSQPFIEEPTERIVRSYEISTIILPIKNIYNSDIVPLWIVVVSACTGTTILLLLVYLLYKCGFFKRNRPSTAPEKELLHRPRHFSRKED